MNEQLSTDSLAILLLCTSLAIPSAQETNDKPLTPSEWEKLSQQLITRQLRPKSFFEIPSGRWAETIGLPSAQITRIEFLLSRSGQLSIELNRLSNLGIWITTRAEKDYPSKLKKRLGQKCPLVLFGSGNRDLLFSPTTAVAVAGSRDVDEKGIRFAEMLGHRCAKEGLLLVSGGARGIDSIAQNAALQNDGLVISILSEGLEATIRRKEIRNQLLAGKLLLLSALPPKTPFKSYNAMARNKYIYGLSDYSVIVSSSLKGGTWSGATENLKYQWVPLFVRDGTHVPEGNQKLLSLGGIPVADAVLRMRQGTLLNWLQKNSNGPTATLSTISTHPSKIDVFDLIWPAIKSVLKTPHTEEELAQTLNVIEKQASLWLERALQNHSVIRLDSTNKYVDASLANAKQYSLFET
ncbi:DNA-processing protein DprA [Heliophilum fasciatum]|uniref:Putative Rossmann fold nucleotide-binding protein DprA/Smf involved in DNA uptake n=1 Tax=Heliophilum fasciatum TaxID=35700 RepID=A0A4R2RBS6_9FIRM|nr:DNA-processing protein DprA [Heliophilum fasciatum]MCW2279212.1 putative Rossmann fold nucleotide-binding protein DprA/Smf involved in DNA uptake [Heliophilum fasciatum]TCP60800.1 putative Rossmann fold nucleotide-binding protein DprA/Smf involved in DNA uptake [Heliophilum fasciatum]